MELAKQYITNETGDIQSVVIDFKTFQAIESALLDKGLAEAMEAVRDEEELSLEEAQALL